MTLRLSRSKRVQSHRSAILASFYHTPTRALLAKFHKDFTVFYVELLLLKDSKKSWSCDLPMTRCSLKKPMEHQTTVGDNEITAARANHWSFVQWETDGF